MFSINFMSDYSLIENILLKLGLTYGDSSFKVSSVIISIAVVLFTGFLLTRLTKLVKLPNVTAYIIAGLLIGPYVFNIIPKTFIEGSEFVSDLAVAFVSFSAGEYFKLKELKKGGAKVILITIIESICTFAVVFCFFAFIIKLDILFSLVLGALSSVTAPTSTLMIIKQTKSKGEYVNILLETIALDNILAIILFSISISVCITLKQSDAALSISEIIKPIGKTFLCLGIGIIFGFLLKILLPQSRTTDNRLIIVIALIMLFCGICALMDESPLLGCMGIGAVYTNIKEDDDKLFGQVNYFIPPIMLIFFVRSGMNFNLNSFFSGEKIGSISLVLIAIIYFVLRLISKYSFTRLGATITGCSKNVRRYVGLGLISQAGVAIGLAALASRAFINCGEIFLGNALNTIILAAAILYEIVGPACSKLGLYLSKSYSNDIDEVVPVEGAPSLDNLIKQINEISKSIEPVVNTDEEAYNELLENENYSFNKRFINRRK